MVRKNEVTAGFPPPKLVIQPVDQPVKVSGQSAVSLPDAAPISHTEKAYVLQVT